MDTDRTDRTLTTREPGGRVRLYAAAAVLAATLTAIAVLGARGGNGTLRGTVSRSPDVNRIAYVDLDARIWTVNPDGSDERRISPEGGFYTWPTWSPDARRLVFSRVAEDDAGDARLSLLVANTADGRTHEIYVGEPGTVGLLAEGVVHYPLWSPDGRRLAFIAVTSRGLTLLLDDLGRSTDSEFVLDQGPLWFSWSPDSRYMMVHRGPDHFLVNAVAGPEVNALDIHSLGYRVPAWHLRGKKVALVSQTGPADHTLVIADVNTNGVELVQPITEVPPDPAFDGRPMAGTWRWRLPAASSTTWASPCASTGA